MILSCPACHTRYLVAPSALGATGRKVRCAKCGQSWFELPPTSAALSEAAAGDARTAPSAPPPASMLEGVQVPRPLPPGSNLPVVLPSRRPWQEALRWLVLVVVLLAGIATGVAFRDPIVQAWPPSGRLYALAGVETAISQAPSFNVRNLKSERVVEDGRSLLRVSGEVVNLSTVDLAAPRIRLVLKDREAREIDHWTEVLAARRIAPGEAVGFSGARVDPPADAVSLQVTLLTEG